jgi:hypothetical protein
VQPRGDRGRRQRGPYGACGGTDRSLAFDRSSGQQGQQWHFQVSLTGDVTAVGAALAGPPTVTRAEDEALFALEAQAVAGGTPEN